MNSESNNNKNSIQQTNTKYSDKVYDHYSVPHNVGKLDESDENVGTGIVGAPSCGDVMKLQIKVDPKTEEIIDVKFKTFGCTTAIASSSYATTLIKNKTIDNAKSLTNKHIVNDLALPPIKVHCSVLAEGAIKAAINDYYTKQKSKNIAQ